LYNSFLSDVGIFIELIGFLFLIAHQLPQIKRLRKRDRTKGFYDKLFPIGIVIVIFGLILQISFFPQDQLSDYIDIIQNMTFGI